MSQKENLNNEPESLEDSQSPQGAQEVVEVEWEEVKEVYEIRKMFLDTQQHFAEFLLTQEKKKRALMDRLDALERELYNSATALQESKSVSQDFTYEFKLPNNPGEKAYFIRKDG